MNEVKSPYQKISDLYSNIKIYEPHLKLLFFYSKYWLNLLEVDMKSFKIISSVTLYFGLRKILKLQVVMENSNQILWWFRDDFATSIHLGNYGDSIGSQQQNETMEVMERQAELIRYIIIHNFMYWLGWFWWNDIIIFDKKKIIEWKFLTLQILPLQGGHWTFFKMVLSKKVLKMH